RVPELHAGAGQLGMRTPIYERHEVDEQGRPAGGVTVGRGFTIAWQCGPLAVDGARREPNGAFVEDVIQAVIGRLEAYQRSEFRCQENENALANLQRAAWELDQRTKNRIARGVEGTHAR